MSIEKASVRLVEKPWGVPDLGQRANAAHDGRLIGELWFERQSNCAEKMSLLLKVLMTSKALSVQVHPDDAYAQAIGLANGKTEAWYILSADAGAKVAVGLNTRLSRADLRVAIEDGSVARLLAWHAVEADDIILVPAGTIHAIGAGISLVEVQQNSDITFRILDPDHGRPLDIEQATACAHAEPAACQLRPERMSDQRSLLVSSSHFVFERIELEPNAHWCINADPETWIYCLSGSAKADRHDLSAGVVIVAEAAEVPLHVGQNGVTCLVAYPGREGPAAHLLSRRRPEPDFAAFSHGVRQADTRKDLQS